MTDIGWTNGLCSSDGEDIYYEVSGSGDDVVVFGHGLGGNHAVWFQQVPAFAPRYRVVTWDQRGFGKSTNRARTSGPAAAATDIGALLDHLDVDRAHLIGQSMGGWAVVGFALRSPERTCSLVVADSTAGIVNEAVLTALKEAAQRVIPSAVVGRHRAVGDALSIDKTFLYQQLGGFRTDVDDAEMAAALFGTRYPLDDVAKLTMPILCVVGAQDDLMAPTAIREVAALIPGARVVEIADAGHSPYFEQPAAWNDAVLEFLGSAAQE